MLSVRRRPNRWNLSACLRVDLLRSCIFSGSLEEVTLTITREIVPVYAKPAGFTAVCWSQGSTPRKYAAHDTYSLIFLVHTHYGKLNWPRKAERNGGCDCCSRPLFELATALMAKRLQPLDPNSQSVFFFGFIQMLDTLSTNGEHLRVAEVKSFPVIPKSMRSVNGDRNGANLKKWSVLLICTI